MHESARPTRNEPPDGTSPTDARNRPIYEHPKENPGRH